MCNNNESTKHMLFECERVKTLWGRVGTALNVNISWKQIVCAFSADCISEESNVYNHVISTVSYAIFKENSFCKFNKINYASIDLMTSIKKQLFYYKDIFKLMKSPLYENIYFPKLQNLL